MVLFQTLLPDSCFLERAFTTYLEVFGNTPGERRECFDPCADTKISTEEKYNTENMATRVIESVLKFQKLKVGKDEKELELDITIISKALRCLYLTDMNMGEKMNMVRRHQVFIIHLIDLKQMERGLEELKTLYFLINEMVSHQTTRVERSFSNLSWIFEGIPFSLTYMDSLKANFKIQIVNVVVAFHFLAVQSILHFISTKLRLLVLDTDGFWNLSIFYKLVATFLSSSNFMKWLNYSNDLGEGKEKNFDNLNKVVQGILWLNEISLAKSKKKDSVRLSISRTMCILKSVEFQLLDRRLPKIPEKLDLVNATDIIPYALELKERLTSCENTFQENRQVKYVMNFLNSMDTTGNTQNQYKELQSIKLLNEKPDETLLKNLDSAARSETELLHELPNISLLLKTVKNFLKQLLLLEDIELKNFGISILLHIFNLSHRNNITLLKEHLLIFDSILIYVKSLIDNIVSFPDNENFIVMTIELLFFCLTKYKQFKRIRNLSNLLYNLGNRGVGDSLAYWKLSVSYEKFNFSHDTENSLENFNALKTKVERIGVALINSNDWSACVALLQVILHDLSYFLQSERSTLIDLLERYNYPTLTKLLTKCLVSDETFVTTFFGIQSPYGENFKCASLLNVVKCLDINKEDESAKLVYLILQLIQFCKHDLYLICIYHLLGLKFMNETHIDLQSLLRTKSSLSSLLLSGILLRFCIKKWDKSLLSQSTNFLEKWLSTAESKLRKEAENFEIEIVRTLIKYLSYNCLHGYVVHLITVYRSFPHLEDPIEKHFLLFLEFEMCHALLKLFALEQASKHLTSSGTLLSSFAAEEPSITNNDLVYWKLLQLEYCILQKNGTQARQKHEAIWKFIDSKDEFKLDYLNQNLSLVDKFKNLTLIVRFQILTSRLNLTFSQFLEGLYNLRTSIKILNTLIKKLEDLAEQYYKDLKWAIVGLMVESYRLLIDYFHILGISRDFLHFVNEFRKINDNITSPFITCINYFQLSNNYLLLKNFGDSKDSLVNGNSLQKFLDFHNVNIEYEMFRGNLVFLQAKLFHEDNQVEDRSFKSNSIGPFKHHLEETFHEILQEENESPHSVALSSYLDADMERINVAYFLSLFSRSPVLDFDLVKSEKEGKLIVLVLGKQLLFEAQKDLSSLPQFSAFNESVSSMPSSLNEAIISTTSRGDVSYSNNIRVEIINKLIQVKEILLNLFFSRNFKKLKHYEMVDLARILNLCMSSLSSLTIFKKHTEDEKGQKDCQILSYFFYLQEIPRSHPFLNDREVSHYMSSANIKKNGLIPATPKQFDSEEVYHEINCFYEDIKNFLPVNWSVVTLDVCPYTGDFLLSKIDNGNFNTPFFLRIPLKRRKQLGANSGTLSFSQLIDKLKNIIERSDLSTKPETTSNITTREARRKWWKLRFSLDIELRELLDYVESEYLGGFKGIFQSTTMPEKLFSDFKADFSKIITSIFEIKKSHSIINCSVFDDNIMALFLSLSDDFADDIAQEPETIRNRGALLNDVISFIVESLIYRGEMKSLEEIDSCRLQNQVASLLYTYSSKVSKFFLSGEKAHAVEHLVLVPSGECSLFPWESLKCMKNKSVSRIPSISILVELLKGHCERPLSLKENNNVFYLLNPSGDLYRTESRFGKSFGSHSQWEGFIGEAPDEREVIDKLTTKGIFIYLGHGGCEQYIRTSSLFKNTVERALPASLLMGCSSGSLRYNGLLEPDGNILNWLTCGSPMIVANLWDVTDKDIDTYSFSVFSKWGLLENNEDDGNLNISLAVQMSRNVCNLKYLNGSAPVVYGLPFYLKK